MISLTWAGSPAANILLATVHFATAAFVVGTLEVTSENQRLLQRGVRYTGWDGPKETTVDVKSLLALFLFFTGVFHLAYAFLGASAAALRFIEYSITASIMIVIIALLSGESDGDLLLAVAVLMASCMYLGLAQDQRLDTRVVGSAAFWLGWVPFLAAWLFVLKRFFATVSQSGNNVPGFVKAIVWVELALFSCFAFVQYYFLVRRNGPAIGAAADYSTRSQRVLREYSGAYNVLSVTAKLTLALIAYFGLKAMK